MSENFKVIVIGGGPSGLVAAHALAQANIDFALLESRPTCVIDAGSNLVLSCTGLRILGQLGLTDEIAKVSSTLTTVDRITHDGSEMSSMHWFELLQQFHGTLPRVLSRHDLTKALYENLPATAQAKCHTSKKVAKITRTDSGIWVSCVDGSSFSGSIAVGADGVHSIVRRQMRALALEHPSTVSSSSSSSSSGSDSNGINDEHSFLTTYRCLWIRFPTPSNMTGGITRETHGPNISTQFFTCDDTAVAGIYEKLEGEPQKLSPRYTVADEEALVEKWGHIPIAPSSSPSSPSSPSLTIKDAYAQRAQAGLVSLEEGVVPHWSWDSRIVLTGDAAHKFTPSTGQGCNQGMQDIVCLVNRLHRAVVKQSASSSSSNPSPSKAQLAAAFKDYQESRQQVVQQACDMSHNATGMSTWQTWSQRMMDQYVFSLKTLQHYFVKMGANRASGMEVFEFIEGEEPFVGSTGWVNGIPSPGSVPSSSFSSASSVVAA